MSAPRFVRNGSTTELAPAGLELPALEVIEAPVSLVKTEPAAYPWPPPEVEPEPEPDETEPDDEDEDDEPVGLVPEPAMAEDKPRLPALPSREWPWWLRDPRGTISWALTFAWLWLKFRAVWFVPDVARAAAYAPRGAFRAAGQLARWATDAPSAPLMAGAVERKATTEWLHLNRARREKTKVRAPMAILAGLGVGALVFSGLTAETVGLRLLVGLGVVFVSGWHGRPAGQSLLTPAVISEPRAMRPSPDMITKAFVAAGLSKPDEPIEFIAPGIGKDGDGWSATIKLPYGAKASTAVAKREDIAGGLDIDEARVFLERIRGDKGSARRVNLWIANRDPFGLKPTPSPLASMDSFSMWDPIPFGTDARGRKVGLPLVWSSLLVGARPRQGKTVAGLAVGCAAALDFRARLGIADFKGGRDWRPFEAVAYWYGSGIRDAVMESYVRFLEQCVDDMNRRYETLAELPDDVCPDSKVTPAICANRRLNMPLTVLLADEAQRALEHKTHGTKILELWTEIAKVGPAAGYILGLFTQKPGSDVIPDDLRGQLGTRFSLNVRTWQASDTILGAGSYKAGLDASKVHGRGVGILLATDDSELADAGGITLRTHPFNGPTVRQICTRGRQARIDHKTLEGMAAGETVIDEAPAVHLLDDIDATFLPGETELWNEVICKRLAEANPAAYDGWTAAALTGALKPYGEIQTGRQIWGTTPDGTGRNRRGIARQDVLDALAARMDSPPKTP